MAEIMCTVKRVDNGFIVSDGEITVVGYTIEGAIDIFYKTVDSKSTDNYKHGLTRTQYNAAVSNIKEGRFIEAVKEIRAFTGMSLREAHEIAKGIRDNL
jgi:ribosomal protein L7/L12